MNQRSPQRERATHRRALAAIVTAFAVACSDVQDAEHSATNTNAPLHKVGARSGQKRDGEALLKRDGEALLKRADLARLSEEARERLSALFATSERPVAVVVAPANGAVQRLRG